jgi:condensin complex subunit 1
MIFSFRASKKQDIPPNIRRGALIILSMTGRADKEILSNNMDILVKIGIGEAAKVFLALSTYRMICFWQSIHVSPCSNCRLQKEKKVCLQKQLIKKGSLAAPPTRFPPTNAIFTQLTSLILEVENSEYWYGIISF